MYIYYLYTLFLINFSITSIMVLQNRGRVCNLQSKLLRGDLLFSIFFTKEFWKIIHCTSSTYIIITWTRNTLTIRT